MKGYMDLYHERRHKYTLDYLKTKYLLLFFEFECIDPSIRAGKLTNTGRQKWRVAQAIA